MTRMKSMSLLAVIICVSSVASSRGCGCAALGFICGFCLCREGLTDIISRGPPKRASLHRQRLTQLRAQLQPCPMQPTADRSDGNAQDRRNLLVIELLHFAQDQNRAVLRAEAAQCLPDLGHALLAKQLG